MRDDDPLQELRATSTRRDVADVPATSAELVKLVDSVGVGCRDDGVTFGTEVEGRVGEVTIAAPARDGDVGT